MGGKRKIDASQQRLHFSAATPIVDGTSHADVAIDHAHDDRAEVPPADEVDDIAEELPPFFDGLTDVLSGVMSDEDRNNITMSQPRILQPDTGSAALGISPSSMLATARPICIKCGFEVDVFRAQIVTKGGQRYKCNQCNNSHAALSKHFGKWPDEFAELTPEEQMDFWKTAKTCQGIQRLKSLAIDTLTHRRVDRITARLSGTFLPLTVYNQQGYDTDKIVQNCRPSDIEEHPVLGTTYRVAVRSLDRSAVDERERQHVLQNLSKKATDTIADAPSLTASSSVKQAVQDSGSDASSESDSSSSSSSDKKKKKKKSKKSKKSKKTKKDKKAKNAKSEVDTSKVKKGNKKAAVDPDELKAKQEHRKQVALAQRTVAKLAYPIQAGELELKDKLITKIASFATEALQQSVQQMKLLQSAALKTMQSDDVAFTSSPEHIQSKCKDAMSHMAVVQNMLAVARTHFK